MDLSDAVSPSAVRLPGWLPGRGRRGVPTQLDGRTAAAVFAAGSDPQLLIDHRGQVVLANAAAGRLFGEDVTACSAHELLEPLAGPDGDDRAFVTTARRRDGVDREVRVRRTRVPGSVRPLVVLTVQDLTQAHADEAAHRSQRHEIHALRGQVSAVLAAVTDRAVILVDPHGHLVELNRAAEKMLGRRAVELVGHPFSHLSHRADLDAVRSELGLSEDADPLLELARAGLPNRQDWTLVGSEGRQVPVTLSITTMPVADTGAPGFVVIAASRGAGWEPMMVRPRGERLLLDLDDAETRALRWQVGGSVPRRR